MTPKQFLKAYKKFGSIKAVARNVGTLGHANMTYNAVRKVYVQAVEEGLMKPLRPGRKTTEQLKTPEVDFKEPVIEGSTKPYLKTIKWKVPEKGVKRYLFTCAQNNTEIHLPLWLNLQVLAMHYGAEIHVARFTYIKSGLGARGDKMYPKESLYKAEDCHWVPAVWNNVSDDRIEIAPGLVWCGEMNILPTAVRPLSGLEVYTGRRSGIFPHVKIAMESIASGKHEGTKFNYTTGTITKRNYIQRKQGLKAEFHHCYGALLVEVDSEGNWFVRQINGDSGGTIYDLDICVKDGELTTGHRPEAILWGDIHVADIDPEIEQMVWWEGEMLDTLRPKEQHLGDILDFRSRSHHEIKDPHMKFKRYMEDQDNVRDEIIEARDFLVRSTRDWVKTVVIDSNHHQHLGRWLREQNGHRDPMNAQFWLAMQQRVYDCIGKGVVPDYFLEALKEVGGLDDLQGGIKFLAEDESYIICPDANGGIECGMHGDRGPNGSRGNALAYARMGRKGNVAHTHSARIVDGIYQAGTSSNLNADYTKGPSSWSHTHIITYPNGKRAMLTCWKGKWRA